MFHDALVPFAERQKINMKDIWNKGVKDSLLIYCSLYTIATIVKSISYLSKGIYEDPSGNWHELDRAIITLIVVIAYALIRYTQIKNFAIKSVVVYVPTMLLAFLYVWFRGLTAELASSAYRDIFINYTIGFLIVSVIFFILKKIIHRKEDKISA